MKRLICGFFVLMFTLESTLWAGLGSDKAMYVGGTVKTLREKDEGVLSTEDSKVLSFQHKKQKWVEIAP